MPLRILGVDPGLVTLGLAVVEVDDDREVRIVYANAVVLPRKDGSALDDRAQRCRVIGVWIRNTADGWHCDTIAVEGYSGSPRASTALALGIAFGAAASAVGAYDCVIVPRVRAVRAVGAKSAGKDEVIERVYGLWASDVDSHKVLDAVPRSRREHVCDAVAVAVAAAARRK